VIHLELNAVILQYEIDDSAILDKPFGFAYGKDIRIPQNFDDVARLPIVERIDKQEVAVARLFWGVNWNNADWVIGNGLALDYPVQFRNE
jgi:hypothetical protein